MYKPNSLRKHITEANPDLNNNPDKLLVFADEGKVVGTGTESLSFEYNYRLNLIITDYTGDADAIMVPLLAWLQHHQPDLLANPEKRANGIRFSVDFNNHESIDLSLEIDLSERVIVSKVGTGLQITHAGEAIQTPDFDQIYWELYSGNNLLAQWRLSDPE
jgi:hypothetical protein